MLGWGSSPLARGLLLQLVGENAGLGIIPARAGFTQSLPTFAVLNKDHPRSRGVYPAWGRTEEGDRGSSPLARGLLAYPGPKGMALGIIPARAGFTLFCG